MLPLYMTTMIARNGAGMTTTTTLEKRKKM
jgi:hypothetical protein